MDVRKTLGFPSGAVRKVSGDHVDPLSWLTNPWSTVLSNEVPTVVQCKALVQLTAKGAFPMEPGELVNGVLAPQTPLDFELTNPAALSTKSPRTGDPHDFLMIPGWS
jgi:hypothetical protein